MSAFDPKQTLAAAASALILKPSATSRTVLERFDHRERVVAVVAAIAIRLTTFGTDQELAESWPADPNGGGCRANPPLPATWLS